jgi:hypothetical protein
VGQDGGQSIPLAGETLFLFSDTLLIKAGVPGQRAAAQDHFLANSAAVATACRARSSLRMHATVSAGSGSGRNTA